MHLTKEATMSDFVQIPQNATVAQVVAALLQMPQDKPLHLKVTDGFSSPVVVTAGRRGVFLKA